MNDELLRRISEALDSERETAGEPDLAETLREDAEAARYARHLRKMQRWMQTWPLRQPDDAAFEAQARRIEERLGEAFEGDFTLAPSFDDEGAPALECAAASTGAETSPSGARSRRGGTRSAAFVSARRTSRPSTGERDADDRSLALQPAADRSRGTFVRWLGWLAAACVALGALGALGAFGVASFVRQGTAWRSEQSRPAPTPVANAPSLGVHAPSLGGARPQAGGRPRQAGAAAGPLAETSPAAATGEHASTQGAGAVVPSASSAPLAGGGHEPQHVVADARATARPMPTRDLENSPHLPRSSTRSRRLAGARQDDGLEGVGNDMAPPGATSASAVDPSSPAASAAARSAAEPAPAAPLDALDRETVRAVMRGLEPAMRACLGQRRGPAEAEVVVDRSGRVRSASVGGTLQGTAEGSCIARTLRSAQFPPFEGAPRRFRYPIEP